MRQSGASSPRRWRCAVKRPSVSREKGEPNRSRGESRGLSIAEGEVMVFGARGNAPTSRHGVRGTSGKAGCGHPMLEPNQGLANPKVRSERSPRGRAEATPSREKLQSASTRPRGKGVPTPNPARRRAISAASKPGASNHPAGTRKVLIVCRSRHRSVGRSHAIDKGTLGAPGAHHVRRTGGYAESSEVGTSERVITPKPEDDHHLRPLGFERLERDQARGSCETSLLNRAAPSRAHRAR